MTRCTGHVSTDNAKARVDIAAPALKAEAGIRDDAEFFLSLESVLRVAVGLTSALTALVSPQIPIDVASASERKT